jgi:hypothetical protein
VPGVASQTVELPHGEHVTGLQPLHGLGELRAFRRGPADAVVGKDPRSAGGLECGELQIKVLFRGGDARGDDRNPLPAGPASVPMQRPD